MTSSSLPIAFWQLLYPWFANAVAARSIQLSLIFHAVAANTPSAWMSAMLAAGAAMSTLFTVPVGRLFNRWGPGPLSRTAGLFCLAAIAGLSVVPFDHEHMYFSILIWILAGQSILFTSVATYRGMGSLFTDKKRLIAFARMNIVSNLSDIVTPLIIGWLFFINPDLIPIVVGLLTISTFLVPQPKIENSNPTEAHQPSLLSFANLKKFPLAKPVYLAILIGAAIHSTLFIFDIIIPMIGSSLSLTSKEIGMVLSTLALSQAVSSTYLSIRPFPLEDLFKHFLNGLLFGGVILLLAFWTQDFTSLLIMTMGTGLGFGMIQPISMSLIYQHTSSALVGDAVSIRLMLNSIGRICAPMLLAFALGLMSATTFLTGIGCVMILLVTVLKWNMTDDQPPVES